MIPSGTTRLQSLFCIEGPAPFYAPLALRDQFVELARYEVAEGLMLLKGVETGPDHVFGRGVLPGSDLLVDESLYVRTNCDVHCMAPFSPILP